jgi:hypothetical protein
MGERAECVMLNKSPHIIEAVEVLDDILRRMQHHQVKMTSRLRPLHLGAATPLVSLYQTAVYPKRDRRFAPPRCWSGATVGSPC